MRFVVSSLAVTDVALVFVQVCDLVDQATLEAFRNLRVILVKRVVYDVLSDELGSGWNFSFSSGHQEIENLLYLFFMLSAIVLSFHELSNESEHSWEIGFWLSLENLINVELLVILNIIVRSLRSDVV